MVPKGNVLPIGPPITEGEWQNFILAIRRCWNADVGSEAASANVTIRFNMTPDGMPMSELDHAGLGQGAAPRRRSGLRFVIPSSFGLPPVVARRGRGPAKRRGRARARR